MSSGAPIPARSSLQPVVTFATIASREASEHVPLEHSPVNHLLMVLGTDLSVPTTKDNSAAGFIHAASGEVSRPFTESVQEEDKEILQTRQYKLINIINSIRTVQMPAQQSEREKRTSYDPA